MRMGTMGRRVNRLFDLEFDEVSSVDRPANQHGLIAIAKAMGQEGGMTAIFTEDGTEVDVSTLVHGQEVRTADGEQFVWVVDGEPVPDGYEVLDAPDLVVEGDEGDEGDDEDLGKAFAVSPGGAAEKLGSALESFKGTPKKFGAGRQFLHGVKTKQVVPGASAAYRSGSAIGRHPGRALAATGAGGAGVAGAGAWMVRDNEEKAASLGDSVLEQLSKAVTGADRDAVIAKALDEVEVVKAENAELAKALEAEQDARITEAFIAKAAEYNLNVPTEQFGRILKAMAIVLDDEDLELLDSVFTQAGDSLYDELGYAGGASNSGVLDQVNGLAAELVGKAAGDISLEQASTAMFAANPDAYDAYLAENGR